MFGKEQAGDLIPCGMDDLDIYLDRARRTAVEDPASLSEIEARHARFVDDLRTQDKAQGMMARMIGAEKARRIFYEVTT